MKNAELLEAIKTNIEYLEYRRKYDIAYGDPIPAEEKQTRALAWMVMWEAVFEATVKKENNFKRHENGAITMDPEEE